ncbi:glutathione S-transferase theta-3-like isoform X2 [Dysidea avara]|uniref:glutathione S-transferase theta-3-like isoform X2 n=1 Tax=Dysidea avara TaxID=196820 RepID=UPI0033171C08
MPELRVFYDLLSQPCRAVVLFLEMNKIPYESVLISLREGEQKNHEGLGKVNPFRTIPAIDDNGLCLCESGAILRYLAAKYKVPDHWYPSKLEDRARVDECLDWSDSNIRAGAGGYFVNKFIGPKMFGKPEDPAKVEESKGKLDKAISSLENHFLSKGKFINGDDISIADLKPFCEITQLWVAGVKPYEAGSKVDVWINNCIEKFGPAYDLAYKVNKEMIEKGVLKS